MTPLFSWKMSKTPFHLPVTNLKRSRNKNGHEKGKISFRSSLVSFPWSFSAISALGLIRGLLVRCSSPNKHLQLSVSLTHLIDESQMLLYYQNSTNFTKLQRQMERSATNEQATGNEPKLHWFQKKKSRRKMERWRSRNPGIHLFALDIANFSTDFTKLQRQQVERSANQRKRWNCSLPWESYWEILQCLFGQTVGR